MQKIINQHRLKQAGVSLFVVLIGLLSLSLAALGIIRSVDTSTLISGNLGFKNATTAATEQATEEAIARLQTIDLTSNSSGFYASYISDGESALDITGKKGAGIAIAWVSANCGGHTPCIQPRASANQIDGYPTQYLITRMCDSTGAPKNCLQPFSDNKCISSDGCTNREIINPYYRIVVRATGPKNSVSYTETYVHF